MAEVQAKLQALSEDYQKLQQGNQSQITLLMHNTTFTNSTPELQASVQSRQKLQAQRTENVGVQKVRTMHKRLEVWEQ